MKKIVSAFAALALLLASANVFAQSSDLISTANVGVWDYYIFNENSALWSSMNGLAAWFNASSGFIRGTAILGGMIGLLIFLFSAISGNAKITGKHIVTWFFLLSTLGLTGTARVTNMYNGQVTIIDNVPALALIPASLFSTGGHKVFKGLDAALQSSSGSYMSVTSSGFVGPLDVLLTLRSSKSLAARPNLNKSLSQVISDCGNNPGKMASVPLSRSSDALAWLVENGRQEGITRIFRANDASQTGTIVGCQEGLNYINTQFTTLASGGSNDESSLVDQINRGARTPRSINREQGVGGTRYTGPQAIEARDAGFGMLVSAAVSTQQNAVMFTKNAITASMITQSLDCINQTGSITTPDICQIAAFGIADGHERFKTDSALAGQGFLKTMFTSMGFLQALFFSMFPIVVIFGLLLMTQIPKVLGGYLFFGAWCQSWLLVVAPIQAYVQNSVLEEINRTIGSASGVSPGLTLGNADAVYEVLSLKLAMAGDLMASSQMLSLAILSGSMIAMSSLANKWSGARQMDSSLMQPKVADSGSIVKHAPMYGSQTVSNGKSGLASLVSSGGASQASISSTVVTSRAVSSGGSINNTQTEALTNSLQAAIQKTHGSMFNTQESRGLAEKVGGGLKATMQASGITGAVITRAFSDAFKGAGMKLTDQQEGTLAAAAVKAQSQAVKQLPNNDVRKLENGTDQEKSEVWGKVAGVAAGSAVMLAAVGSLGAGPAGMRASAALMASRGQIMKSAQNGVGNFLSKNIGKGGAVGAGSAIGLTATNLAGAIAGEIKPIAQAMTDASVEKTKNWQATSAESKATQDSVQLAEGFNKTAQAAIAASYSVNASTGTTTTASIPLDNASMNNYAQNDEWRSNAATSRANHASRMSPSQIDDTMNNVRQAMNGHSYSSPGARQFAENTFFTHFASGGEVTEIFKDGGNPFGVKDASSNQNLTGNLPGRSYIGEGVANAARGNDADWNDAERRINGVNIAPAGNPDAAFNVGGKFEGQNTNFKTNLDNVHNATTGNPLNYKEKPTGSQAQAGKQPATGAGKAPELKDQIPR